MIPRSVATVLLVAMAASPLQLDGAGLTHFSVTQVRQLDVGAPVVRTYLDLTDSAGQPLEALSASDVAASLGEWVAEPINVVPFASVKQGVAYVFLVDISKSLSPELFGRLLRGIETWVNGMGPLDRAAIIAFGESSQLIVDFTADKQELLAGLSSLGPTDLETLLHQALSDALELSRRLDPELPGRRALVIFSDGKDEGSVFAAEDILDMLRDDPSPIYAIGYSRLRDPAERRTYLNLLQRFASNSGGAFFAAEETRFVEAYNSIWQKIQRVWVADFLCEDCRTNGSVYRLQVQITSGGQVLSSGGSVRLLPRVRTAAPPAEDTDTELSTIRVVEPEAPEPAKRGFPIDWRPLVMGLSILSVIMVVWGIKSVSTRRRHSRSAANPYSQPPPSSAPIDPRSEPAVLDPPIPIPMPSKRPPNRRVRPRPPIPQPEPEPTPEPSRPRPSVPPKQVRLIVVRGSRKGRQYSFVVSNRAIVGKRSDCDCVLAEESGVDPIHFELIHESGSLFIENLSDRSPTAVEGHPLTGRLQLSSDTLIGAGDSILRIVFY